MHSATQVVLARQTSDSLALVVITGVYASHGHQSTLWRVMLLSALEPQLLRRCLKDTAQIGIV